MRTTDFLNTLGVNTHIGSDPYNDPEKLDAMIDYLGIANVRQSAPISAEGLADMEALGKLGAKLDLIVNGGGPVDLDAAMENVRRLAPYLNAVEGVNEVANFPISYKGIGGVDAAAALQKDLYAAVRSNPALDQAAVYMFTLGGVDPSAFPSLGDLSAYADYANVHAYPPDGLRPIFVLHAAIAAARTLAASKPVVLTETGFYTLTNGIGWGGVPETMQASYLLGALLDQAAAGTTRTYLYDLIDDGPDPQGTDQEDHFGLFRYDGTPKLAAQAIRNMNQILSDPRPAGATFTPKDFQFTAVGVPYNHTGNTLAMAKSDGTRVIALWNEQPVWDTKALKPIEPKTFPVEVALAEVAETALVYDPLVGTEPVQTLRSVSLIELDLIDHPVFIIIPPDADAAGADHSTQDLGVTTAPTSLGGATSSLALSLSQDAWQGDALFTVSVDGQQVGGVRSVAASHMAGEREVVTIPGPFGPGPHAVAVQFLNDAYGGAPDADRNLYVEGATMSGVTVLGRTIPLMSNGSKTFIADNDAEPHVVSLRVAQDAWAGDAQFTVSIDGEAANGPYAVTALRASGGMQEVSVPGFWSPGGHQLAIAFINDAYGGTTDQDRNLYIEQISYDGKALAQPPMALFSNGVAEVALPGAGYADLTLHLAQDAWQGDALFTIMVDGFVLGGGTATASHADGQSQETTLSGALGPGMHEVTVVFLNDAYGGSAAADRNLYVTGIDVDGVAVAGSSAALFSAGTARFSIAGPVGLSAD